MSCNRCHKTPCGCKDSAVTTAPTNYSSTCPLPQVCAEFTYSGCIIYNGPGMPDIGIAPGMSLNDILQILTISIVQSNTDCVSTTNTPVCLSVLLSVVNVTSTTIQISWSLISESVGGYGITWTDGVHGGSASVASNISTYTIINLTPNTYYNITVFTECSPGNCPSALIRVKTSS